jgi:hypothetical protein
LQIFELAFGEAVAMAIDFTFTKTQRELQLQSRKFAREVLAEAAKCETLATPEERFLATKPIYEAMVAAGYLRKCIPAPAGGDGGGLVDMAILAEEFYSVNSSVTLTMLGTVLGLLPILLGGTPEQRGRLLVPFLKTSGAPLAGFCFSEPGGSANAASPPPGEGVRTVAKLAGNTWTINGRKKWVSSATGWDRAHRQRQSIAFLAEQIVARRDHVLKPKHGHQVGAVTDCIDGPLELHTWRWSFHCDDRRGFIRLHVWVRPADNAQNIGTFARLHGHGSSGRNLRRRLRAR